MKNIYDIIIIGAGPTGLSCAIEAQKNGLSALILEKGMLANSIYRFPTNMTFFSTSLNLEIGDVPFISHSEKPNRQEALEYYRRVMTCWNLKIQYQQTVNRISDDRTGFKVKTDKNTYQATNIIIATGFYDNYRKLNVSGEDLPKVKHYYDDVHPYIQQKVIVGGGANAACDVALETWSKGAEVTMVVRESELYHKVKYWILPNIKNRIKEGSIKAYMDATIAEIRETEVDINTPQGTITIPNDYVLAMTGYEPNYALLDQLEIEYSNDKLQTPIHNENTLESNRAGIYLAGVLIAGRNTSKYFIENTRTHGEMIVRDILLKSSLV